MWFLPNDYFTIPAGPSTQSGGSIIPNRGPLTNGGMVGIISKLLPIKCILSIIDHI